MSGERVFTVEEKQNNFQELLNKYLQGLYVDQLIQPTEITQYLKIDKNTLRGFSSEDCAVGAYLLSEYAAYLQREQNKEKVILEWCDDQLSGIVLKKYDQYRAFKMEDKIREAAINDSTAKTVFAIKRAVQSRISALDYMSTRIENMSQKLSSLQRAKHQLLIS